MAGMARSLGWYLPEQLVLKVTLVGSAPKIWRRVEVHSGLTLHDLHYVIQCVFDWEDSHLYHFLVPPGGKLTRAAMRDAIRYHTLPPDPMFGDDDDEKAGGADEALVGRVFTADCKQIVYEYDFGDSWEHLVKLEKREPGGDQSHVPRCLAGQNAAPRDDMGGMGGYYHWVDVLRDAEHESHEEAVDILGEDFDVARFDLDLANTRLAQAFAPAPKPRRKPKGK
jgi:hypothetical protein